MTARLFILSNYRPIILKYETGKKSGKNNDGTNANDKRFILLFPIKDSYKINPSDLANRTGKYKHSNDSQ